MQVTVPASPNNNVQGVVNAINAYGTDQVTAAVINGRIAIYSAQPNENSYIQLVNQTNDPVNDLGLVNSRSYYQSTVFYGKSSQMPLWGTGQTLPRVSGSVWIKTSATGNGANMLVSKYSESLGSYVSQVCDFYPSTVDAISAMDSSGGKAIPEGTLFSRYRYGNQPYSKLQLMTRIATGPTVATGTVSNPAFPNNTTTGVQVSIPGSNALSTKYFVTMPAQGNVTVFDFVTAWTAANLSLIHI